MSFKVDMTPELFSTLNLQVRNSFFHGHRYVFGNKSKLQTLSLFSLKIHVMNESGRNRTA